MVAVRDVRLGLYADVETREEYHERLKGAICEAAAIIPDCEDRLLLEMIRLDPRDWRTLRPEAACIDVAEEVAPSVDFRPSSTANDMMVLRACAVFDPYMPLNGLGFAMLHDEQGRPTGTTYALLARSAFVIEPIMAC